MYWRTKSEHDKIEYNRKNRKVKCKGREKKDMVNER